MRPRGQARRGLKYRGLANEIAQRGQGSGGLAVIGLQLLGLIVGDEGIDNGLQTAFHDQVELVQSEADAVVGEAVLREVVGADLLAAVAGADLLLALLGQLRILPVHFPVRRGVSGGRACPFRGS